MIGKSIAGYQVVAKLGEGGMGEVYRARDSKLNRDVALKVLPASVAGDPERLARFRREAQVLASLNHPNIGHIYGFEDSSDTHALVLELIEGPTLAEVIAGTRHLALGTRSAEPVPSAHGPVPVAEALSIAKQIADALEAAHEAGIVHRDLKPANVKVREDGTVKVLDFGLAKALAADGGSGSPDAMNSPTLTARATQMGVILGTAAYMAPEQAKGKTVDRRADIWAFGLVLYEMLSGKRGYHAEDISETLAAVLTRDVDWSALPVTTPPRVLNLLQECLVRDPKQRLRDIGDARRTLEKVISGAPDSSSSSVTTAAAPAVSTGRSTALPWAVAAVAVLAAGALAWLQFRPSAPSGPPQVVTRSRWDLKDLSGFVNISRDGKRLVYSVSTGQAGFVLMTREMDQFAPKTLAGTEGGLFPVLSPGGESIIYSDGSKIKKVPFGGGPSIILCSGNLANGAAWSDDDTFVFSGAKGLWRVAASGGTPEALTTVDSTKDEVAHLRPQFLPGGRSLLFTVRTSGTNAGQSFAVLDLQKGGYRVVAPGGDNGRYAPTGHLTYLRNGTVFALPFDLDRLTPTGGAAPVLEAVSTGGPPGTADYTFSDNGVLIYSENATRGTTLAWANRQGAIQTIAGQVARVWGTGRLSPNGQQVANGIQADKDTDIWVADLTRATVNRLTFGGENDDPIWTPDGRRIIFSSTLDGKPGLYWVPADGSTRARLLLADDGGAIAHSMTPDGKMLFYSHAIDGKRRIMTVGLTADFVSGSPQPMHDAAAAETDAMVSPDGRWVAFTSMETGGPEIYALPIPAAGGKTRISPQGGRNSRWGRNGRELFYWSAAPGAGTLYSVAVQTSAALQVGIARGLFDFTLGTTWDTAQEPDKFLVELIGSGGGSTFVLVTNWFDELRRRAPVKK